MSTTTKIKPSYLDELTLVDETMMDDDWVDEATDEDTEEEINATGESLYDESTPLKLPKPQRLDIEGASLNYSNLRNRQMSFLNITASQLRYANLEGTNLVGAHVYTSDFHGANLRRADLEYSDLEKSDFSSADLTITNMQGSNISECDFSWADIRGANLSDCIVDKTKFRYALYDSGTILPFDKTMAKKFGMIFLSQQINDVS